MAMFKRTVQLEEDIRLIIEWLWMMPLLALPELAEVSGLSYHRCRSVMLRMYDQGLVSSVALGMTVDQVDRWFLTTSGVHHAVTRLGYAIEWQVSERGLRFLIQRLPMLEARYSMAARLWSLDKQRRTAPIYRTPNPDEEPLTFPHDLALQRFQWQRDSDIHAIMTYEHGAWVPWIWVGAMTTGPLLRDKAARGRERIATDPQSGTPLSPAAVVLVGQDFIAGALASGVWTGDHVMVVTAKGRLLKPMRPQDFTRPYREDATVNELGAPENIRGWVETDPVVSALNGKPQYNLFQFVAQWPGGSIGQLTRRFRDSHRHVSDRLKKLAKPGILVELDGSWYLGRPGMLAAARMDRISHHSIYGALDVYLREDGVHRRRQQKHDRAVIDTILADPLTVEDASHGRRAVLNLPDRTQVAPDAYAPWPGADGRKEFWRIEVELAARHDSTATRKVSPYRLVLQHTGSNIRFAMVLGTDAAEAAFLRVGRGLNMRTTTLHRLRKSDGDIWRYP